MNVLLPYAILAIVVGVITALSSFFVEKEKVKLCLVICGTYLAVTGCFTIWRLKYLGVV